MLDRIAMMHKGRIALHNQIRILAGGGIAALVIEVPARTRLVLFCFSVLDCFDLMVPLMATAPCAQPSADFAMRLAKLVWHV